MENEPKYTSLSRVLKYYPQRVQVLVMAVMNLGFIAISDLGIELSTALIGGLNSVVLALLVFFYGEQKTWSRQHVEDFFAEIESGEVPPPIVEG